MKAGRFKREAASARVRGIALPPPNEKKTVPPTVHSWDWTNQDQTAIIGQMVRQCEGSKTTPLSWVGFRRKSKRTFLVYIEG